MGVSRLFLPRREEKKRVVGDGGAEEVKRGRRQRGRFPSARMKNKVKRKKPSKNAAVFVYCYFFCCLLVLFCFWVLKRGVAKRKKDNKKSMCVEGTCTTNHLQGLRMYAADTQETMRAQVQTARCRSLLSFVFVLLCRRARAIAQICGEKTAQRIYLRGLLGIFFLLVFFACLFLVLPFRSIRRESGRG